MTTTTDPIQHMHWCGPTGDRQEVRIETFRAERTDTNGVVIARPRVSRCLECGEQTVQG